MRVWGGGAGVGRGRAAHLERPRVGVAVLLLAHTRHRGAAPPLEVEPPRARPQRKRLARRVALDPDGEAEPAHPLEVRRVEHVDVVVADPAVDVAPSDDEEVGAAGDGAVVGARARRAADRPHAEPPRPVQAVLHVEDPQLVPRALGRAARLLVARVAAEAVEGGPNLRARVAGAAERQRLAVVAVAAREELGPQVLARVEEVDVVEQRPRRRALAAEDHHPRGVDRRRRVPRPRRRRVARHREHAPRARRQVVVLERVVVERPAAPVRAAEHDEPVLRLRAEHVRRRAAPPVRRLPRHRLLVPRRRADVVADERVEARDLAAPAEEQQHVVVVDAEARDRRAAARVREVGRRAGVGPAEDVALAEAAAGVSGAEGGREDAGGEAAASALLLWHEDLRSASGCSSEQNRDLPKASVSRASADFAAHDRRTRSHSARRSPQLLASRRSREAAYATAHSSSHHVRRTT